MQAIENGTYYDLIFEYNPRIVSEVKEIHGRWWDAKNKCWKVPKSQKSEVDRLVKKYGNPTAELPEVVGAIEPLPELGMTLPLKRPLYHFQERGVAYALKHRHVIMGDEPGLGKTSQAIASIVAANAFPCLIICPASLKINWQREWEMVAGRKAIVLEDKIKDKWLTYYKAGVADVFITNYQGLKKYFVADINKKEDEPLRVKHIVLKESASVFKALAIDEGHRCKDGGTQQTKFVIKLAEGRDMVLDLTGTPVVNKPKDLIAQLVILGKLKEFGGYKSFMNRYCGGNGSGAANLRELNYKLSQICFYRRQKKEVLTELPDKVRQIVMCDITTMPEYKAALDDLANYLKQYKEKSDPEIERSMRGEVMVKIGVCKDISARGKLEDSIEVIDEVTGAGEKIVVFVHQKSVAQALKAHYPHAVSVTGDDDMNARQTAVDNFQKTSWTNIIICSIKAAGVGLTLTASSRVLFIELPWHAADADQCEDRCHRIGQKDSVQCTYLLGSGTIDEQIYDIIEAKRSVANTVTGSTDNVQREIIDKIANSLFNIKNQ